MCMNATKVWSSKSVQHCITSLCAAIWRFCSRVQREEEKKKRKKEKEQDRAKKNKKQNKNRRKRIRTGMGSWKREGKKKKKKKKKKTHTVHFKEQVKGGQGRNDSQVQEGKRSQRHWAQFNELQTGSAVLRCLFPSFFLSFRTTCQACFVKRAFPHFPFRDVEQNRLPFLLPLVLLVLVLVLILVRMLCHLCASSQLHKQQHSWSFSLLRCSGTHVCATERRPVPCP